MTSAFALMGLLGLVALAELVRATVAAVRSRSRLSSRQPEQRGMNGRHHRPDRIEQALDAADVQLPTATALRLWGGSVIVVGLAGMVIGSGAIALLGMAGAGMGAPLAVVLGRGRRSRRADAGLPSVLDDVARGLRAGLSPADAMGVAAKGSGDAATCGDVAAVVTDIDRGAGLVEALERWSTRRPSPPVRLTVGALALAASTGGARSQAIEAVAATLRERDAVDSEARALATQARSSALVIALSPIAFAVLAGFSDPRAGAFLVSTPTGLLCLTAGLTLDSLGGWWMHRIVGST